MWRYDHPGYVGSPFLEFLFLFPNPFDYKIWRFLPRGGDASFHLCTIGGIEFIGTGYLIVSEEVDYKLCSVNLTIDD